MWSRWRALSDAELDRVRERRKAKAEPGDGSALKPHRPWQMLNRSLFHIEVPDPDGSLHDYVVDVEYFDFDDKVRCYRDGRQHLVAEQPAAFPVPGGAIEVTVGTFGLSRMHLVPDGRGAEQVLRPVKHSAEFWRAVLDHRHPELSRWMGRVAIAILLVGLVISVPQLLELVTQWDLVAERVGTFTSPIWLPAWLNTTLFVAGIAASLERALMLRNHWLIDLDTWWLG